MKKAKFWLYQIIMVAIVSLVLSSPALADKPADKKDNGKTTTTSNNGKGKGSDGTQMAPDGTMIDTSTGSQIETDDGNSPCPDGFVWLDLYNMCIPY